MIKKKVMIVGAFPKKRRKIFGGIIKSCSVLINSKEFSQFEIIKFDSTQISNPPPSLIVRLYFALVRLIKFPLKILRKKPEIILIFCSSGFSAIEKGIMLLISKFLGIKTIIFPRAGKLIELSENSILYYSIIKFLFNYSTLFLSQGKGWKDFAIDKLKIKKQKIKIISNWTATADLLKIGERKIISPQKNNLKILFVGWLEREKGVIELIEAIHSVNKKGYNNHLKLIGDGSLRYSCSKLIKQKNLQNHISLEGWKSYDQLLNYYKESDLFILPSWNEGMPNVLIEAASSGIPSIVTSVGVIKNYFKNNESVVFVKPKNINEISNSIINLSENFELRAKLSKSAHKVAKTYFDSSISLKNLSKIIIEAVN